MKNIWRKMRDCWLDFWEDDELDMNKKHLSQHDKRSLLYGGFMIGVATFGLFSIGIIASMDRMLKTLSAISRIRLTVAVWNGSYRSVSIWFS